jgi:hypothetical protein
MWMASKTHLAEAGEGYLQHLRFAAGVGLMLVAAGRHVHPSWACAGTVHEDGEPDG